MFVSVACVYQTSVFVVCREGVCILKEWCIKGAFQVGYVDKVLVVCIERVCTCSKHARERASIVAMARLLRVRGETEASGVVTRASGVETRASGVVIEASGVVSRASDGAD